MKVRPRLIPGITAATSVAIASACTVTAAQPLVGPMAEEFGWNRAWLALAAALSIAITAVIWRPAARLASRVGVRPSVLAGCLASGLLLLLVLPNLTHAWQLVALLAGLGCSRAPIAAGAYGQLRRSLAAPWAAAALAACAVAGAAALTPWIAQIIYRNSWREGAAACGGLMLLIASPAAYLFLPGREAECRP